MKPENEQRLRELFRVETGYVESDPREETFIRSFSMLAAANNVTPDQMAEFIIRHPAFQLHEP